MDATGPWPDGWVPVTGGPGDPAVITVTATSPGHQTLEFKLPGFTLETMVVAGVPCSRIGVPDLIKVLEAGLPELPVVSVSLIVPEGGRTYLKIVEHTVREIKVDPVEPSAGHLTRDVDPATVVPEFSDFYDSDGQWPKSPAEMGAAFTIREYPGVNVRLNPLRYDAGKGLLLVTERLVVDVVTDGGWEKTASPTAGVGAAGGGFDRVYGRLFANYAAPAAAEKYQRPPSRGRMLVVSDDALVSHLAGFAAWKRQCGIDVTVVAVSELGGTAAAVGQAIAAMYAEPAGLAWVILVGDKEQVPTNVGLYDGSDSDSRYAMVAGDDIYPDLFVSRLSAANPTQLLTQVNRIIAYEKTPATGAAAAWYGAGAGIASDEGTPSDFSRADLLRDDLLGYGFTAVDQIYQGQGGTTADIRTALERGCSVVNYLGHGTGFGWTSVPFSSGDVQALGNRGQWPWIIDVSCSNGDFDLATCFAEAWLRAGTPEQPTGAVAVIAATSPSPWLPPTMMQAEVVDLLTGNQANTMGALCYSGLMRVLDLYGGLAVAMRVVEQNVIFGDCSLMVRTAVPGFFDPEQVSEVTADVSSWIVYTGGPEGSVAALTTESVSYLDVGIKLEVEPAIQMEHVVIKTGLEVSSVVNTITTKSGSTVYQVGTRNASTTLTLRDGETQVLAGLLQRNERESSSRLPGLGDIPVLGRLFSSQAIDGDKTEILLSITPRILRNMERPSDDLAEFNAGPEAGRQSGGVAPVVVGVPANQPVIAPATSDGIAPAAAAPPPQGGVSAFVATPVSTINPGTPSSSSPPANSAAVQANAPSMPAPSITITPPTSLPAVSEFELPPGMGRPVVTQ